MTRETHSIYHDSFSFVIFLLFTQVEKGEGLEFYIGETWRSNSSGEDLQRLILVADNMEEKEEWLKVMEEEFLSFLFV